MAAQGKMMPDRKVRAPATHEPARENWALLRSWAVMKDAVGPSHKGCYM